MRFAMGAPAPEVIPVELFKQLATQAHDEGSYTYGATEGEPGLIEALVAVTAGTDEPVREERVVIT